MRFTWLVCFISHLILILFKKKHSCFHARVSPFSTSQLLNFAKLWYIYYVYNHFRHYQVFWAIPHRVYVSSSGQISIKFRTVFVSVPNMIPSLVFFPLNITFPSPYTLTPMWKSRKIQPHHLYSLIIYDIHVCFVFEIGNTISVNMICKYILPQIPFNRMLEENKVINVDIAVWPLF